MSQPNGNESRLDRVERILSELTGKMEMLHVNIESLHSSASELHASAQAQEASVKSLEASVKGLEANAKGQAATSRWHESAIVALLESSRRDGENIAALARIATAHERRLDDLDAGGRPGPE